MTTTLDPRRALERFRLCTRCGDLYQSRPLPGFPTPRRCRCRAQDEPAWAGYDFDRHLELCRCCLMEPLRSGSRWSVWFCAECEDSVLSFNDWVGRTTIPIGRHTMMAGIGLAGAELLVADEERFAELTDGFLQASAGWIEALARLDGFVVSHTRRLANDLGIGTFGSVRLTRWLRLLRAAAERDPGRFGRTMSFNRLIALYADAVPYRPDDGG